MPNIERNRLASWSSVNQPYAAKRVMKSKKPFSLLTSKALGTYSCLHFPAIISDYSIRRLGKFWHMKSLVRYSFQFSQDYYPESYVLWAFVSDAKGMVRLGKVVVIWNVVKLWLSKETAAKVDILGSDYKDVVPFDLVDPGNIPSSLGGTCICAEAADVGY